MKCYAQVHDSSPTELRKGKASNTVLVESEHLHADPGYLSTSRMVVEAALCLALEVFLSFHPSEGLASYRKDCVSHD